MYKLIARCIASTLGAMYVSDTVGWTFRVLWLHESMYYCCIRNIRVSSVLWAQYPTKRLRTSEQPLSLLSGASEGLQSPMIAISADIASDDWPRGLCVMIRLYVSALLWGSSAPYIDFPLATTMVEPRHSQRPAVIRLVITQSCNGSLSWLKLIKSVCKNVDSIVWYSYSLGK